MMIWMIPPSRGPKITRTATRSQPKKSLFNAFPHSATAIAKVLSPIPTQSKAAENQITFSPSKKLELKIYINCSNCWRMEIRAWKNLLPERKLFCSH